MAKVIKLVLTEAEARALWYMAGDWANYPDIMEGQFPNGRSRATAYRAYEKLKAAIFQRPREKAGK